MLSPLGGSISRLKLSSIKDKLLSHTLHCHVMLCILTHLDAILCPYSLYLKPRPCAYTFLHINPLTFLTSYRGSYFQYDASTSFWNFLAAGNYAARFYRFAMTYVTALQAKLQQESFAAVAAVEEVALRILSTASYNVATARVGELLTKATNEEANKIVGAWRDLLPHLITKYVIR